MGRFKYYFPRVLAILYTLFLAIFALDVFGAGYDLRDTLIALFMHLLPNFLLIACLIIAWKKPKLGGILFLALAALFTLFFRTYQVISSFLLITVPLIVIGGTFFLGEDQS